MERPWKKENVIKKKCEYDSDEFDTTEINDNSLKRKLDYSSDEFDNEDQYENQHSDDKQSRKDPNPTEEQ